MNQNKNVSKAVQKFTQIATEKFPKEIKKIILFGSLVREKFSKDSDIDILIVWHGDKTEGWKMLEEIAFDILLETGEYISLKVFSPIEFKEMETERNPFILEIIKEGVVLV